MLNSDEICTLTEAKAGLGEESEHKGQPPAGFPRSPGRLLTRMDAAASDAKTEPKRKDYWIALESNPAVLTKVYTYFFPPTPISPTSAQESTFLIFFYSL